MSRENRFSLWLDFVERGFLQEKFGALLAQGVVNGATSNPAIFSAAITTSDAYNTQLASLENQTTKERYEALAIADIKMAAKLLRATYDEGTDGYISIEVDPFLSGDTQGTIEEGQRLFAAINEPNVMIKIPATKAGYPAMRELMSRGISVNATLIFSPDQATQALHALKEGSEMFDKNGGGRVDAVISIFVSRFDRLLDARLKERGVATAQCGILNAAKIYNIIEQGSMPNIRTLFASTGVKGDNLPADYYIRELLAPHAINTAPLATIEAYKKSSSQKEMKLPMDASVIDDYFSLLQSHGIVMDEVYDGLMQDGLKAFEESFADMLEQLK